jgi:hypothetical protein
VFDNPVITRREVLAQATQLREKADYASRSALEAAKRADADDQAFHTGRHAAFLTAYSQIVAFVRETQKDHRVLKKARP